MSEIIVKPLGEVTSFIAKGIPPKYIEMPEEGSVIVLNQKCNRDFSISLKQARLHDSTQKKVPLNKMLRNNDVLINSTGIGTAGRVAQLHIIEKPMTVDGHMIILRPSGEIDPLYYGYAIKAHQSEIELLAEGSTGQTEINRNRLGKEIMIAFPKDINEQRRIAGAFFAIDKKIEINQKINKNLAA